VFELAQAMRRAPIKLGSSGASSAGRPAPARRIVGLVAAVAEELIVNDGRHEGFPMSRRE
jgi:hypothetical protein